MSQILKIICVSFLLNCENDDICDTSQIFDISNNAIVEFYAYFSPPVTKKTIIID